MLQLKIFQHPEEVCKEKWRAWECGQEHVREDIKCELSLEGHIEVKLDGGRGWVFWAEGKVLEEKWGNVAHSGKCVTFT